MKQEHLLIIGSPFENSTHEILLVDNWVKNLKENDDFTKDMKNKSVALTEKGEEKLAKLSNKDLYFRRKCIPITFSLSIINC